MSQLTPRARTRTRGLVGSLLAAVAVVVLTATSASAAVPGRYGISASGGATFSFLTAGNLVSGVSDDQLFYLSTTGTGARRLPFALHLYNQTYVNAAISTNGNVQPGVTPTTPGTAAFSNNCLPTTTFGRPAVMAFWDDLFFDSNDTSHGFMEGVFVRTTGSSPNRRFTVSWQGHRFNDAGALVAAQAVFRENSQTVTYVYAFSGGASATVGIQSKQQLSATQWTCNSGSNTAVLSGLRLTLVHAG